MSSWMAMQLAQMAARNKEPEAQRFNPRPPGVIQPGSATEDVLVFLRSWPAKFHTRAAIIIGTGRTQKSVDWALLFLRSQKIIECAHGDGRNSLYLRYRILAKVE